MNKSLRLGVTKIKARMVLRNYFIVLLQSCLDVQQTGLLVAQQTVIKFVIASVVIWSHFAVHFKSDFNI